MENNISLTITEQQHKLNGVDQHPPQNTEQAALAFANSGLSVFPVKSDKSPVLKSLDGVKASIASENEIKKWFTSNVAGIAVLCGVVSGNLECIDIDEKYNVDDIPLLERFVALVEKQAPGLIDRLVHETSVNGGHHFVYRCNTIERSRKLARRNPTEQELEKNSKAQSLTLIETRGEGGYIVCHPSPGYKLVTGSFTDIPEITEQERKILLDCACALNQFNQGEKFIDGYPKKRSAFIMRPGDDFNLRGDIRKILLESGWNYVYSMGETEYWRRPGKNDGISASFNNHPGLFYVFSSNADPLEPETWYSKFALLSLLKYEGNFKAAALDLSEAGYGESLVSKAESYLDQYYCFRFNEVTQRVEYRDKQVKEFKILENYDLNTMARKLEHSHIMIGPRSLANLLSSDYAAKHNPFKEYYENLPAWDGNTDYIGQLAKTVTLKDQKDNPVFLDYLKKWLVAAVGCAINPDTINHTCLTLVGPQGKYKTTWLNRLVPEKLSTYSFSGTIDPSNKDTLIQLSECFLINLDELETLSKHELGTLKSIMTSKSARLRRPYDKFPDQLVRRASFAGSINRDSFLTDETGTRRFLVVEIASVNPAHSIDMDKVHAQAYALYKDGFRYWFDSTETTSVNDRNKQFSVQTTEDELVAQYCSKASGNWQTATQVAQRMVDFADYPISKSSARDFGYALKKAGYASRKLNGITRYEVRVDGFRIHSTSSGEISGVKSGVDSTLIEEIDSF